MFKKNVIIVVCVSLLSLMGMAKAKTASVAEKRSAAFSALNEGYPFSFTYGGVKSKDCLPKWKKQVQTKVLDKDSTQIITTWVDPSSGLKVTFDKVTYSDFPAVDRLLYFENIGDSNTGIIEKILVVDTSITDPNYILHRSKGGLNVVDQFEPSIAPISKATPQVLSADNGIPSTTDLPFFKIETANSSIIMGIGWTGNWKAAMDSPDDVELQIKVGMHHRPWLSAPRFYLYPGEKIRTPRVLAMVWDGETLESNAQFRQLIYKHYSPLFNGEKLPAVETCNTTFTHGNAMLTQTTEENQIALINAYAPLGVKVMVTDAGWMQGCIDEGNNWGAGMGSWVPRTDHYPNGMGPVAAAAADNGMIWGLWFAQEVIAANSIIHLEHPDWSTGGIVNFGKPEVLDYFWNTINDFMQLPGFRVYRTDGGGTPPIEPEGPDRMGITEIKHVMGLYEFWDRIASKPDTFRYGCCCGGQRIDLEMISRFHVNQKSDLWLNDTVDQASIWSLSQYLPNNLFETATKNMDDYSFHSVLACSMNLGWDADDWTLGDANYTRAQEILDKHRSVAHLLVGAWYPLLPYSRDTTVWMASQYHRPDLDQGIILAFRHTTSTESAKTLKLYGLTPTATYDLYFNSTGQTISHTGAELMQGLSLTIPNTLQSELIEYKKVIN